MPTINGLIKLAMLASVATGGRNKILCLDCKKKHAEWQEYCSRCGSDRVSYKWLKEDYQYYLSFPVDKKQLILENLLTGGSPETIRDKLIAAGQNEAAEYYFLAARFAHDNRDADDELD